MLLLIDASRANNEQKTGVEWYAYFVIQELKKIVPSEVKVVLYSREPLKGVLADLPANWEEKVLKWPPRRLWTQIRLSWEILKQSKIKNQKSKISNQMVLFVPAHVLPLICPARVVTTIHDLGGLRFPAGYSWFERWYGRWASRFAVRRAFILTPSESVRQEILKLFKSEPSKVRVAPNAYDKEMFHQIEDKEKIAVILKKYEIQPPYFLSISRLEEKKNTAGIIEAFHIFKERIGMTQLAESKIKQQAASFLNNSAIQQFSNYKLVLLGKPGYGFRRIKKMINESKYRDEIILPGWVATEDVPYLMAGAAAFVFPSFYEGFGIPVLEAMACGTPVMAANRAALPEVARDAAILVDPYKPAEIAQALAEIVSSPHLKEELVKRGRERVKEYGWEKTGREVWRILQEIQAS